MRISDWSSDVCSSDLAFQGHREIIVHQVEVLEKAFYEQAFIAARHDEIMVAPMAVDIHDMHHDGAARHLHHGLWNTDRFLGQSGTKAACKKHCLHIRLPH